MGIEKWLKREKREMNNKIEIFKKKSVIKRMPYKNFDNTRRKKKKDKRKNKLKRNGKYCARSTRVKVSKVRIKIISSDSL